MKPRSHFILLCICAVGIAADTPTPLSTWIAQVQVLGAKHRKGETSVQSDAAFTALLDAFEKEFKDKRIQFTVKIKNVKWRDGVAELSTEGELGEQPKASAERPMRIFRGAPIELRMSQEEAAAIKAGALLRFTGTLTYNRGKWGAVGAETKSQQLYTVRHEYLGGAAFVGTFTCGDGEYQVGLKRFVSRWDGGK
ncbi:MAG: hypothetical protein WD768_03695 [Phycisphaeraceae bacterium]